MKSIGERKWHLWKIIKKIIRYIFYFIGVLIVLLLSLPLLPFVGFNYSMLLTNETGSIVCIVDAKFARDRLENVQLDTKLPGISYTGTKSNISKILSGFIHFSYPVTIHYYKGQCGDKAKPILTCSFSLDLKEVRPRNCAATLYYKEYPFKTYYISLI